MTAKSKEIVQTGPETNPPEKPRAFIVGGGSAATLPERKKLLKQLFVGEHADFYAERLLQQLSDTVKTPVIGPSMRGCYEIALGRPCPYVGDTADYYMLKELTEAGYQPTVVSTDEFEKLLK